MTISIVPLSFFKALELNRFDIWTIELHFYHGWGNSTQQVGVFAPHNVNHNVTDKDWVPQRSRKDNDESESDEYETNDAHSMTYRKVFESFNA